MTTREQLTFERFEALCNYLEAEGVLPSDWREALREVDSPEKGREARESARNATGPPDWANAGGNDESPPDSGTSE